MSTNSPRFVVVPAREYSPLLPGLAESSAAVGAQFIVIHTNPKAPMGHPTPESSAYAETLTPSIVIPGAINIFGDAQNFQRWVNLGLRRALELGGEDALVLIINDDIVVPAESLEAMFTYLENSDLVYLNTRPLQAMTPLTGWLFGVRPAVLLMDERYTWWYGDDHLWQEARSRGLRMTMLDCEHEHIRGNKPPCDSEFTDIVQVDGALYHQLWSQS